MAKEHAKNCKLYVGDGYALALAAGVIYAVTVAGQVYKITRSAGSFITDNVKVGQAVKAAGFATAVNNFVAHVFAVTATDITLKGPVDANGNPVVPIAEAAGANVTLKFSTFTELGGQQNTRFSGTSGTIDVSDKNSGGWGASIQGTKAATIEASGIVNWPDTAGLKYVRDQWALGNLVEAKAVMNTTGDFWFTDWSLQNFEEGGSHEEATNYSVSMANALRANMVYWS